MSRFAESAAHAHCAPPAPNPCDSLRDLRQQRELAMTLTLFFSALRWRLDVFLLAVGATVAAAAAVSLVVPPSYRATVSLVVARPEEQSLGPVLDAFMTSLEEAAYIQTQVDIIKSPRVARKVVEDLELAERPSIREAFEEAARDETI